MSSGQYNNIIYTLTVRLAAARRCLGMRIWICKNAFGCCLSVYFFFFSFSFFSSIFTGTVVQFELLRSEMQTPNTASLLILLVYIRRTLFCFFFSLFVAFCLLSALLYCFMSFLARDYKFIFSRRVVRKWKRREIYATWQAALGQPQQKQICNDFIILHNSIASTTDYDLMGFNRKSIGHDYVSAHDFVLRIALGDCGATKEWKVASVQLIEAIWMPMADVAAITAPNTCCDIINNFIAEFFMRSWKWP